MSKGICGLAALAAGFVLRRSGRKRGARRRKFQIFQVSNLTCDCSFGYLIRDENVIDNEGLGRKSSKRCCIFHRQRSFGESSTDSDYDSDRSGSSSVDGDKKKAPRKPRKIARPKKEKEVPDFQRYHA
jgi:hypothetical protein